ncbi:Flp pilus assembly protein CpaB [Pseudomonas sp. NW5]|uniref:Flp pilus assembly protein CpaB n=1 Tax=Pseudomonas sp. NW5 TaxID=2934934 RepID=UPI0020204BBD|nr:Flp pilus assembly protein CpaB [Pseudomonas sp. NW5]MCL7462313.1 Flp pilus assembly protein CpaB [Pseudomonas sp. NW5]
MNSRLTLGLAGLLLVGALIAGYWGMSMSRQPDVAPPVTEVLPAEQSALPDPQEVRQRVEARIEEEQRTAVVVLARELKALTPIVAEDLTIERLRLAPPGSFSSIDALLNRTTWRDIPAGSVLNAASFEMGGPLARMIRPEERALAIAVDEVIGGGGHVVPGDFVDVLLYLRESEKNRDQTAQVVIPALRVLSFGDALGATNSGEPAVVRSAEEEEARNRRPQAASTAVLAVPEPLLTRFMLAAQLPPQIGGLRLAVRSADERLLADYYAGKPLVGNVDELKRKLFQFEKLALRGGNARPAQPQARAGLVPRPPAAIEVYRGTELTKQNP